MRKLFHVYQQVLGILQIPKLSSQNDVANACLQGVSHRTGSINNKIQPDINLPKERDWANLWNQENLKFSQICSHYHKPFELMFFCPCSLEKISKVDRTLHTCHTSLCTLLQLARSKTQWNCVNQRMLKDILHRLLSAHKADCSIKVIHVLGTVKYHPWMYNVVLMSCSADSSQLSSCVMLCT